MNSFNELSLSPALMSSISELGYEKPSPIQAQALPILLGDATDFIGLAATGTGKTAAFGIPLVEKIDTKIKAVQGLVLCPTRELAMQVAGQLNLLGKHKGVKAAAVYGGSSFADQIYALKRGATIVVGTPGRVVDHLGRGTLDLSQLQIVALDEADEMISMGFKDDLEAILKSTPQDTGNIWLFSATMSREVRRVADTYLEDPKQVQVNRTEMLSNTVDQIYYTTQESNKPEVLCKLFDAADDFYGLVFCQTKALVADLTVYLTGRGYRVDCLHGDKDQTARERTMQAFRDHRVNILICTDVAARGLDVKDVTHVINYSLPRELDSYVHRIGRTARSGKQGFAMSLVTNSHRGLVGRIERETKSKMREGKIPTRKEIGAKKVAQFLTKFQDQSTFSRAVEMLDGPWKEAIANMSGEEIVGRFLALTFPEIFSEKDAATTKSSMSVQATVASSGGRRSSGPSMGPAMTTTVGVSSAEVIGPITSGESAREDRAPRSERAPRGDRREPRRFDRDSRSADRGPRAPGADRREQSFGRAEPRRERAPFRRDRERDLHGASFEVKVKARRERASDKPTFGRKTSFVGAAQDGGNKPFSKSKKGFGFTKRESV